MDEFYKKYTDTLLTNFWTSLFSKTRHCVKIFNYFIWEGTQIMKNITEIKELAGKGKINFQGAAVNLNFEF